jgi:hypothetical protein
VRKNTILLALVFSTLPATADASLPAWVKLGAEVRTGYDSNVFQQNAGTLRRVDSVVTTGELTLGLDYKRPNPTKTSAFAGALVYTPSYSWYPGAGSEDHFRHQLVGEMSLTEGSWKFKTLNRGVLIDGDNESPTWTGAGGAPAIGGIAARDRRDAAHYLNRTSLTYTHGRYFLRPVLYACINDYQTELDSTPGHQNYVDRSDLNAGLDLGYLLQPELAVYAGYRYGHQEQSDLLGLPLNYSNDYHRVVGGVEGTPVKWLTLSVQAGADFRSFGPDISDAAEDHLTAPWVDAVITLKPDDRNTLCLSAASFMQPGFSGRAVYQDNILTLTYTRKLTDKLTGTASFRAWNCDVQAPGVRYDWMYTSTLSIEYALRRNITLGAQAVYEFSDSNIPNTPAREFDRVFVGVFARVAF